jgi:hypothetical protein
MDTVRRWTRTFGLVILCVLIGTAWARAGLEGEGPNFGKRYALVVGNGDYEHAQALPNAARDATRIAEELAALRFQVFDGTNLTKAQFERLVKEFRSASADADTVVFYYAGHGFQLNGVNHLVPVDATMRDRSLIDSETVVVDSILASIHGSNHQTLVFLDACRNNPLPPDLRDEGSGEGLAQLNTGDDGIFIAFATQPGNTSRDGAGLHSPFTGALLRHISKPGQSVHDLMINVRNDVTEATLGKQRPWDQSSLRAQFHFNPGPSPVIAVASLGVDEINENAFGDSASRATTSLGSLEDGKEPTFVIRPPRPAIRVQPSEILRLQPAYEEIVGAEQSDTAQDNTSSSDTKYAAVDPIRPNALAVPNHSTASEMIGVRELTGEIQRHLNRLGCSVGAADGVWGPATTRGALAFNRNSAASIGTEGPSVQSLDLLKRQDGSICLSCGRGTVERNGVCVAVAAPPSPDTTKQRVRTPVQPKRQAAERKGGGTAAQQEPQTSIGSGIGVGSFF